MTPSPPLPAPLAYEPSRNAKLRLLTGYFRDTPAPDRGYALAAITRALSFTHANPATIPSPLPAARGRGCRGAGARRGRASLARPHPALCATVRLDRRPCGEAGQRRS